jgi:hypothetical protein
MNYAIVFTTNDAVIIKRIKPGQKTNPIFNVVVDPSLEEVKNTPTKYWKLSFGRVVPMNRLEREIRDLHVHVFGKDIRIKRRLRFPINLTGKLLTAIKSSSLVLLGAIGGYYVRSSNF